MGRTEDCSFHGRNHIHRKKLLHILSLICVTLKNRLYKLKSKGMWKRMDKWRRDKKNNKAV